MLQRVDVPSPFLKLRASSQSALSLKGHFAIMMRERASEVVSLKYNDSVGTGECGRCMISNVDEYKARAYAAQGLRVVWLSNVGLSSAHEAAWSEAVEGIGPLVFARPHDK